MEEISWKVRLGGWGLILLSLPIWTIILLADQHPSNIDGVTYQIGDYWIHGSVIGTAGAVGVMMTAVGFLMAFGSNQD